MKPGEINFESQGKARSINPFTGEIVSEHNYFNTIEINKKIQQSWDAFCKFKKTSPSDRKNLLNKLADSLEKSAEKLAKTMTLETGKIITHSKREVEKSIKFVRYYAENAEDFLKPCDLHIQEAKKSYLRFEPLGPIFNMTSYNYPLFQNIRRVVPALLMGNTVLSRSSSITPQTGMLIEELYNEAGFKNGEFLNLITAQDQSEMIITNPSIRGVSYVGSLEGSQLIGSLAGRYSKKFVSENGSNDTFVVMKDAELDWAVERAIGSRLKNAGQSTISAKIFLVEDSVYNTFRDKLIEGLGKIEMGNPMDEKTMLGPLANKADFEKSFDQVKRAQEKGAKLICGGGLHKGGKGDLFFEPTILEVAEGNPILDEETFAPIFSFMRFKSEEDIIRLTNNKKFGFATSIFTTDEARAEKLAPELEVGALFINTRPHFHTGVPMGGVKDSGVGLEGGMWGAREFSNIMTVFVSHGSKHSGEQGSTKCERGEMGFVEF